MNNLKEMESISQSEKEDFICQTCGDVGFTNAFVYCVKCLDFVIHRYCLYVIPKTFTERVIWYCESCKPVVQNQATSPQVQSSPSQKNKAKKKINPIRSETSSSSSSDSDSDSSSISSNRNRFDEWEARVAQQNQRVDRIIEDMIISYPHLILGDNNPFRAKNRSLIAETNEVFCHSLTDTNRDMERNASQDNYYTHAQPIIDPVWRGSFSARVHGTNCDVILEGLVGHLSNKACDKVCEEANMLPSLLELQMHPKPLLWPRSFQDTEPSDDHIALYFFPGDPINERGFDDLVVDMMDGGLAMRATVTNADLLIFTSASLPLSFRRFQGKYYLWGVFRGKGSGPTSEAGVDMDSELED